MPLKYIENTLLEEKIVRDKFGYKKMFDSTIDDFLEARQKRGGKLDHQLSDFNNKLLTDATSYDVLRQPNYYEKFNYTIPAERKTYKNYDECDEVRRVLDFPYYKGEDYIDNLFTYRNGPSSVRKFSQVASVPQIRPKTDYR